MDIPKDSSDHETSSPSMLQSNSIQWKGSGSEFFRIWIINTALTIVTLGFYWPWARIRTRRYFYSHTELMGHAFEYLARPIPILIGYCVVMLGLILYNGSQFIHWALAYPIMFLFFCVWPWLYWKAIRFRFHNSSYRGIRFIFSGTLGESYKINFLWSLLIFVTGGLIYPFIEWKRKNYLFNGLSYGKTRFQFDSKIGKFFMIYGIAYAAVILLYMVLFGGILSFALGAAFFEQNPDHFFYQFKDELIVVAVILGVISYICVLVFATAIQVFVTSQVLNYCLNQLKLENGIEIEATIKFWALLKIRLMNLFFIIVTFGIYTPWAAVKRHQYIVSNITVKVPEDAFDHIVGNEAAENAALGDATADIFDFDIGF